MQNKSLTARLIGMNFLQFAIWGAYLTAMGIYLSKVNLGDKIWAFYSIQGIVSIFMPTLMGIVADRLIQAQKTLGICHLLAAIFMGAAGAYCVMSGAPKFSILFSLYTVSVAFYMPTIALSNSVAFSALQGAGRDTVKDFPPIRTVGTVGFIVAALITEFIGFKVTPYQFIFSASLGLVLGIYAFTLPAVPVKKGPSAGFLEASGLKAFSLFKDGQMAIFFIFSMLLGAALQVTNSYAGPYLDTFEGTYVQKYSLAIITLSQVAEACCILLIPFFMKKFGIKKVILIAMFAWVFRFAFLGIGGTDWRFMWIILSMIVYGVAFDFFNVSGSLYVDKKTSDQPEIKSSAQGLFMLMTNGLGASIGTWAAGLVVNNITANGTQPDNWPTAWFIFAGYALLVGVLFMILFKDPQKKLKKAE